MPETENTLQRRLQWFLLLRVGVTTCLLGLTVFMYSRQDGIATPASAQVLGAIGSAYFVSLLSGLLLTKVRNLTLFSYVQVVFDTVFVSGIVLLSGGLCSPFLVLYHLAILNAAYLLFRPGALIAASVAAVCYGTMVNLLYYGVLPPLGFDTLAFLKLYATPTLHLTLHLIAAVSSFYLVAVLGSYLIQRLTQVETLLAERDVAFDQLSSLYQGVVQNLESGVLITNASGSIEYANAPMAEILDTTSAQLQGKSATALFPMLPESPPTAPIEFSLPSTGPDTKERTLRASYSQLSDTYGNQIGLLYSIQDVTGVKELESGLQHIEEAEAYTGSPAPALEAFAGLVGRSEAMNAVYQLITKVAASTTTILITGESGTGKELVARAIHDTGSRAQQPFVPVNCGAIPDSLIESELFGHIKGAFTGAVQDRTGLFRQADSGTIFLDEIGELPLPMQVKLLRVLQNQEVTPIGGQKSIQVDVRVLAATNRKLEEEVAAGRFREDLFYRLNVIRLALPPLRERAGDLPLLIHHFLQQLSVQQSKEIRQISPQAMRILLDYAYPGNIRELENLMQHAITMSEGETLRRADLPAHVHPSVASIGVSDPHQQVNSPLEFFSKGISLDAELEAYEQAILRAALDQVGGIQKRAAEVLGINYRSLRHRLQKYQLSLKAA